MKKKIVNNACASSKYSFLNKLKYSQRHFIANKIDEYNKAKNMPLPFITTLVILATLTTTTNLKNNKKSC